MRLQSKEEKKISRYDNTTCDTFTQNRFVNDLKCFCSYFLSFIHHSKQTNEIIDVEIMWQKVHMFNIQK